MHMRHNTSILARPNRGSPLHGAGRHGEKLRVSRSKKTARSRGYAFLEFAERKVAEIAAKAMNNYLLFGRQLDVHIMENDAVHRETFKHGNRDWTFKPTREIFRSNKNAEKTDA